MQVLNLRNYMLNILTIVKSDESVEFNNVAT